MRKALELKEDEPKAFFIKASARQKGTHCSTELGPPSRPIRAGHRYPAERTAPAEGLGLFPVTPWPLSVLASHVGGTGEPGTARAEFKRGGSLPGEVSATVWSRGVTSGEDGRGVAWGLQGLRGHSLLCQAVLGKRIQVTCSHRCQQGWDVRDRAGNSRPALAGPPSLASS